MPGINEFAFVENGRVVDRGGEPVGGHTRTFASEQEMLRSGATQDQMVFRSDTSSQWRCTAEPSSNIANWFEITGGGGGGSSPTHLSYIASPTDGTVTSSTGADATLPLGDGTNAGLIAPAQTTKLAGIQAGAQVNPTDSQIVSSVNSALGSSAWQSGPTATNLSYTPSASSGLVVSDTGTDATIPAADGTNAGLLTAVKSTKLDGIATGATANDTDANLKNRSNHTGTQLAATISDFNTAVAARFGVTSIDALSDVVITSPSTGQVLKWNGTNWVNDTDATGGGGGATNLSYTQQAGDGIVVSDTGTDATVPAATSSLAGLFLPAEKTKLQGIATGATANDTDANLTARGNHTGTQLASTVSDFSTAADARIAAAVLDALSDVIITSPSSNQVLKFNGTAWVNGTDATSGAGGNTTVELVPATTAWAATITPASYVTRAGFTGGSFVVTIAGSTLPSATVTLDYTNDMNNILSSVTLGTVSGNGSTTFTLPTFSSMPGLGFKPKLTGGSGTGGTVGIILTMAS